MLRGLSLLMLGALLLASSTAQAADTQVKVKLASGRAFTGILDSRTDAERLWLRWRVGEVELQRPIAWQRIASAELNGEPIDLAELQDQATDLATPGRVTDLRLPKPGRLPIEETTPPAATLITPVVRSIRCDAWLANWDADAEFDGLMVEIEAFDENGQHVAAQGTVAAELITIDYQRGYLNSTSGGRVPTSLGRWTHAWQAPDKLRLEFQGRDPQRTGQLDRYGWLKLRVTIPGSGVFEREIDGLRMRPFTPVQNSLWR